MPAHRTTTPRSNKTKSYARPLQITNKENIDSADERTPTLSPNGSDDNDRSSDFDPAFETPSKSGNNDALYVFEDDDDEDMKPDLSDDEISYPGIVTDSHQQESEDEEGYGKKGKGKGKGKSTPKKPTPKKTKTSSGSVAGGSGKKPGVAWIPEEDWVLFQKMHPKTSKPNWQEIADCVGRDAKSCSNRYATMSKNLEGMVKGAGRR